MENLRGTSEISSGQNERQKRNIEKKLGKEFSVLKDTEINTVSIPKIRSLLTERKAGYYRSIHKGTGLDLEARRVWENPDYEISRNEKNSYFGRLKELKRITLLERDFNMVAERQSALEKVRSSREAFRNDLERRESIQKKLDALRRAKEKAKQDMLEHKRKAAEARKMAETERKAREVAERAKQQREEVQRKAEEARQKAKLKTLEAVRQAPVKPTSLKSAVRADEYVDMSYRHLSPELQGHISKLKELFSFPGSTEGVWDKLEETMDDWGEKDTLELNEVLRVFRIGSKEHLTPEQTQAIFDFMKTVENTANKKIDQYTKERAEKINTDTYSMRFMNWISGGKISNVNNWLGSAALGLTRGLEKSVSGILGFFPGIDLDPNSKGIFKRPDILQIFKLIEINFDKGQPWTCTSPLLRIGELPGVISDMGTRMSAVYEREGASAAIFDSATFIGELFPPAAIANKVRKIGYVASARHVRDAAVRIPRILGPVARGTGRQAQRIWAGSQPIRARAGQAASSGIQRVRPWGQWVKRKLTPQRSIKDRVKGWLDGDLRRIQNLGDKINKRNKVIDNLTPSSSKPISNLSGNKLKESIKEINDELEAIKKLEKDGISNPPGATTFSDAIKAQKKELKVLHDTYRKQRNEVILEAKNPGGWLSGWKEKYKGALEIKAQRKIEAYDEITEFYKQRKQVKRNVLVEDLKEVETAFDDVKQLMKDNELGLNENSKEFSELKDRKKALKDLKKDIGNRIKDRKRIKKEFNKKKQDIENFNNLPKSDFKKKRKIELKTSLSDVKDRQKEIEKILSKNEITKKMGKDLKDQNRKLKKMQEKMEQRIKKIEKRIKKNREDFKSINKGTKVETREGKTYEITDVTKFKVKDGKLKGEITVRKGSDIETWQMKNDDIFEQIKYIVIWEVK